MSNNRSSPGRHCMVVDNSYPLREPRVERQAQALIANGYEVDVICLRNDGEPANEVAGGVNVYRLPVKRRRGSGPAVQLFEYLSFFTLAFAKLTALHRKRHYGVVQVHNLPDFLIFAGLVPKLSGARLILDLHDLMPEFYASRFNSGMSSWPVRLVRLQEQLSCRFADHVISVTDLWQGTLVQRGLPAEKITVVMNVANDKIFRRGVERPARESSRFNLIYHGTLTHRYGVDLAIRAIDIARRKLPAVHLTIHGIGEYRDELMRLAAELGLGEHIRFSTRTVAIDELPNMIRAADVGVVPYRRDLFTDGILPTKLMEYVALGVPVIAARTPVIESYFDETMVQFFSPGDPEDLAGCILALHADRQRLRDLAWNADTFNQRYSWEAVSAQYLALVQRMHTR